MGKMALITQDSMKRKEYPKLRSEEFQHVEVRRRQRTQQRKLRCRQKYGSKIMITQCHGIQWNAIYERQCHKKKGGSNWAENCLEVKQNEF